MTGPGPELLRLRGEADKCRSCGTCRSVCPIFAELRLESAVARGKVALIRSVLDGELELSDVFDEKMQLCLNCKSCVASCPNDVRVDDLVLAARCGLVESGRLPFLKRAIFRLLLKRGRLLAPVGRVGSFFQRVLMRGLPQDSSMRILLPLAGIDRDRVLPEFAPRSFMSRAPERVLANRSSVAPSAPAPGERARVAREARTVAYFVGCATNLIYPETASAIVDALTGSGVEVIVPKQQRCCGTPVFNAGDFVTARGMARRNIRALQETGADAVVTGCASCGLTLKREYEEILGIEGGVGLPVFDFTEFLVLRGATAAGEQGAAADPTGEETADNEASPEGALDREKIRVTYHDPCHLVRGQAVEDEPRAALRSLPWVEFVEMRDADRCCGGGGTFCLTHYDISKEIGRRKAEAVRDADVDFVATECPVCMMQLKDMLTRYGVDVKVASVAEITALGPSRKAI